MLGTEGDGFLSGGTGGITVLAFAATRTSRSLFTLVTVSVTPLFTSVQLVEATKLGLELRNLALLSRTLLAAHVTLSYALLRSSDSPGPLHNK